MKKKRFCGDGSGNVNINEWNQSLSEHFTLIAIKSDIIAGFGDIDRTGYLDRLYVHKDYQSQGIATTICNKLERAFGASKITTYVCPDVYCSSV